jgi:ComF family protein
MKSFCKNVLYRLGMMLLDLLFPSKCYICHVQVSAANTLCSTCWRQLDFITLPVCNYCGERALREDIAKNCSCRANGEIRLKAVRSVLYFNQMAQNIVHKFKYNDGTEIQNTLASWLANAADDLSTQIDFLTPVPLHVKRLKSRYYNQSALLANQLGKKWRKPVLRTLLIRIKDTVPQVGLSKKQRIKNIRQAFIINRHWQPLIKGKSIALIDDVITTGATARECANVLLKNGAANVFLLTIARKSKE